MPNRPQKCGIKFWLAFGVKIKYIINDFPYLGKDEIRSSTPIEQFVVLKLAEPYLHRGINVTTVNFCTACKCIFSTKDNFGWDHPSEHATVTETSKSMQKIK